MITLTKAKKALEAELFLSRHPLHPVIHQVEQLLLLP